MPMRSPRGSGTASPSPSRTMLVCRRSLLRTAVHPLRRALRARPSDWWCRTLWRGQTCGR
eukprot:1697992-Alexandrium_andersonii.AAC.1